MTKEDTQRRMHDIADRVRERIPLDHRFVVLVFPKDKPKTSNYISDASMKDCIESMEAFIEGNA